jgi:2-polyprenyl-6-methoxyphenol hydroxylase-like FAD-dependent oxidoreductase
MTQPVLVVGAGPVGLTAALSLAQQGVACRLIDLLAQLVAQSRAAAIHARTCELLAGKKSSARKGVPVP